jgi:type III pantothenate kinase
MILTLDVGNSQIFGGVFEGRSLTLRFRKASRPSTSSDEMGLFLRSVLRENGGDPTRIEQVALCSVVPEMIYPLRSCCRKYFGIDPFILQAGAKTGLQIRYRNPLEVGPDRIANAIGATHLYPGQNLLVVDLGTATTFDVVRQGREYLGGIIVAGLKMAMEALEQNTARLPTVEIVPPAEIVGRSTVESIQAGLYFGAREMVRGLTREIRSQLFPGEPFVVVGTGGFSRLFEHEPLFDALLPDLILVGLERALALNPDGSRPWRAPGQEGAATPSRATTG